MHEWCLRHIGEHLPNALPAEGGARILGHGEQQHRAPGVWVSEVTQPGLESSSTSH